MVSAQARREQARYAISRGLSQRRACALIHVSRANLGYVSIMPGKNGPIVETMRRLSGDYPRFGSRRIRIMLAREGIVIGKERCSRLWAQAGLQVPRNDADAALPVRVPGRLLRALATPYGVTISSSTRVPTASN
jgi:putative transposase